MDDQPPPRKKSRFFAEGKSKIGSLLHPFRKHTAHHETAKSFQSVSSASSVLRKDRDSPLSNPVSGTQNPNEARFVQHSLSAHAHMTPPNLALHPPHPAESSQNDNKAPRYQISYQQSTSSEEETDIESDDDNEHHEEADRSDQENDAPSRTSTATPALDRLTVRANRPKAIYGAEQLYTTGAGAHVSIFARGSHSTSNPGTASGNLPLLQQGLETEHAPFTFRADQPLSAFPQNPQSVRSHGQGLAQITQHAMHHDTGPLGQSSLPLQGTSSARAPGYIDTDRDAHGQLLPINQRYDPLVNGAQPANLPNAGIPRLPFNTPLHISNPDATVPDNLYSSPGRIQRAQMCAQISRKRKRPDLILPPPAYVYQRTNKPNFNILDALLLYPELVFAFASTLPVKDLISLYAINRDFHTIIDTRFTTVILGQAYSKAPESARVFQFRFYKSLCRNDPASRIPHPNIRLAEQQIPRKIPSFGWLQMILHREKVIHELMTVFAEDGIPLPYRCRLALKRIWFLMDVPDNARRIGFVHNRQIISNLDLYFAACFFTKLDMRLNDPTSGEKGDGLRKLLLGQRGFTPMLLVLKREMWTTRYEVMREWIKFKYTPAADEAGMDIFGVPASRIGKGRLEFWGLRTPKDLGRTPEALLRPDQLVVREAFRRGFRFDQHYVRFMLYGYVRPDTLENYAPRDYGRRIDELRDEEYEVDDLVGGVSALGMNDKGYDELLDLGMPNRPSVFTAVRDTTTQDEMDKRAASRDMAAICREWWLNEMRETGQFDEDEMIPRSDSEEESDGGGDENENGGEGEDEDDDED